MPKPDPIHVMCDLESLGTAATSAIASLGAVVMWKNSAPPEEAESFYLPVNLASYDVPSLRGKFTMQGSTITWWMQQSDAARAALTAQDTYDIGAALGAFKQWLEQVSDQDTDRIRLWGNGASFDNAMLAHAYEVFGEPTPWRFWNDRCYRTIRAMAGHLVTPPERPEDGAHNAFADARHQASYLLAMAEAAKIDLNQL